MLPRQAHRVRDVIEMPVRNQHRVDLRDLKSGRIGRVPLHPGINENHLSGIECELECAVTEPGNRNHTDIVVILSMYNG